MSVKDDWDRIFAARVQSAVPWMPPPVFVAREDGVNQANVVGIAPVTILPPLLASVLPIAGPAGAPVLAFPPQSGVDDDFVAHECGHGAHEAAARQRDALEGKGTAGTDMYREVAAILSPGVTWPSSGPDLRDEWFAEAFRKAATGNTTQLRYPNPPGQISPYPLDELRAYFATMNRPRLGGGGAMVVLDPAGYLLSATLTRGFGVVTPGLEQYGIHTGIDLALARSAPVPAVRSGVVYIDDDDAYYDGAVPATWSGIAVWIRTDDGEDWGYCHLARNVVVAGQRVNAGDVIGFCGSTGASTAAHLHLERRVNGIPVDPYEEVLMLSKDTQDQIREIVRDEVGKGARAIGETITSGFNTTLVHRLRRLGRFLKGGAYDVAGVGGTDKVGYPDDTLPLA